MYLEVAGIKTSSPASDPEKESSPDDFQVQLTNEGDGVIIMKYVGQGGKVVIPDTVDYIGSYAFYYTPNLKSVKFPSTPIFIAPRAFLHCGISAN